MNGEGSSGRRMRHAAVVVATVVLPPGQVRRRYRREFDAEMESLTGWRQYLYAVGIVAGALALRRAVGRPAPTLGSSDPPPARRPVLCRLHLHHEWHTFTTEDGQRYRRCVRCGLDDDEILSHRFPNHGEMVMPVVIGNK